MDVSQVLFSVVILFFIGYLIYLANQVDLESALVTDGSHPERMLFIRQRGLMLRWMLYGICAANILFALLIVQVGLLSRNGADFNDIEINLPQVDSTAALINLAVASFISMICFRTTAFPNTRNLIQRLSGKRSSYNLASSVHQVALVLALCFVSITLGQLVVTGGLSGLAQDLELNGISLSALVFQTVIMILAALLGIGFVIRRDWSQAQRRLGLRMPTSSDLGWGIGLGVGLYVALLIMVGIWAVLVPPEQIAQQSAASDQIAQSFGTLPLALLLSASAALSEEILFRGALQPVFGLGLSSLFFALVHIQYTFTPATLIIFVVSLALGWLRNRQSTTAAIIAHFTYNFVQLMLAILAAGAVGGV